MTTGQLPTDLYNVQLPIADSSQCNYNLPLNPNLQLCVGDTSKHACSGTLYFRQKYLLFYRECIAFA
jgi:hypothetical protein